MIYVKRQHLKRYLGLCPALDTAINYLENKDLNELAKGRNEVDASNVFINRFDYETIPESEAVWEGHARYGDIHIMISGTEKIGVSNVEDLRQTVYKEADDFLGFTGPVANWYPMAQGDVLVVFPEDIHMVKVQLDKAEPVSRAVVKFKL